MSTVQAEDVLKNTFKQLEKMLHEVRRQKTVSPQSHRPSQERKSKPDERTADGSGTRDSSNR